MKKKTRKMLRCEFRPHNMYTRFWNICDREMGKNRNELSTLGKCTREKKI